MAEEHTETVEAPAPQGKKKLILIGVSGLVLIAIGVVVWMTILAPEPQADGDAAPTAAAANLDSPIYQSLHPPLVVNFKDKSGDSHLMQITMEVMSRKQSVINAVREHTPAIRNALILLYGGAVFEEVDTRAGKEKMLADGRDEIARIVAEASGERGVEALYFTALVIQ
ncbi:MAG TPA: flagellar basal body-associated FliL family protein [Woeseiaceae bacterium]|nr:flagellar basal body-associated FliL family protein [Woeseiaceae bacterium]